MQRLELSGSVPRLKSVVQNASVKGGSGESQVWCAIHLPCVAIEYTLVAGRVKARPTVGGEAQSCRWCCLVSGSAYFPLHSHVHSSSRSS